MDKIAQLREKANRLPLLPGVYIMKDVKGEVIYVGKAKALKNRVTSYFRGEHLPKVAAMVSHVDNFDVIIAASEFEALVLENSLIKRHQPHYNILLRDDKTYPFIRVDEHEQYPRFTIVGRTKNDGAKYYGPFGGRSVSKTIIDTLSRALGLPDCSRCFPRDIGKERPCLNYQLKLCRGWCLGTPGQTEYRERLQQAEKILSGDSAQLLRELTAAMEEAAASLRFEAAAELRDRIRAVQELTNRQTVIRSARADTDAVGFYRGAKTAFVVLHYTDGDLTGKDLDLLPEPMEEDAAAVSALVRQYYARRGAWPRQILLPVEIEDEDALAQLLTEAAGRKVEIATPRRGIRRDFSEAAQRNAREESVRAETESERRSKTLEWLQKMTGMTQLPRRIESYDISNTGNFGIVSSMVVFNDGKPARSCYRKFKMKTVQTQDDFASMYETICRRLDRYLEHDEKFSPLPDLLLIDGGVGQVGAALQAMGERNITVPIFGMVKDDRHRTRALTTPDGREIGIQANPAVFALVGNIQEETHRFAITYHRTLRKKTIASSLEDIPGVGEKRRKALLKQYKTITAVREASFEGLCEILPKNAAQAVYDHFHPKEETP